MYCTFYSIFVLLYILVIQDRVRGSGV